MIYPLPNKFSVQQVPEAPVYLYIPEYKGTIIRKVELTEKNAINRAQLNRSQRLFDNAAPGRIANAIGTAGTSDVIDLIIQNENSVATKVGIWPQHFLTSNFGNEAGITITSAISSQTFAGILSAINSQRLNIKMLQAEGQAGWLNGFAIDIVKTDPTSNWNQTNRLNFLLSPFQFQADIIQLQTSFILDFATSFEFTLPGNSSLCLKIFRESSPLSVLSSAASTSIGISSGFSNFDNFGMLPEESEEEIQPADDFLSGLFTNSPKRQRRKTERMASRMERKSAKQTAKIQKIEAKAARRASMGHIVRSMDLQIGSHRVNAQMEQEFYQKARDEFNQEEMNAIYRLSDTNYLAFEELVLNYDFNSIGNNLSDFLK